MIRVGCDRVGGDVWGGSSGGSSAVFREGTVCGTGGIGDSARAEMSAGTSWGVRTSKGTRRRVMGRCLERRQVLNLGVPSRESIVDPRRQIVTEGSSRRERGASRPCNGLSGRGIRRDELGSLE